MKQVGNDLDDVWVNSSFATFPFVRLQNSAANGEPINNGVVKYHPNFLPLAPGNDALRQQNNKRCRELKYASDD